MGSVSTICGMNTLSVQRCMGCRVRDSPKGSLARRYATAFLLESRPRDKLSIRPQLTLHEAEGEKKTRMINVPSVWSVSFFNTHTHTHTHMHASMHTHKQSLRMNGRPHRTPTSAGVCTQAATRTRTHTFTGHHTVIFQRIRDEKCLSSTLFLANLCGEWRGIDLRARQLAFINKRPR